MGLNWNFAPNWLARVGYRDPGDADHFDVSEELQAGLGYSVAINDRFDWITELAATFYQGGDSNPDDSFDLTSGGRYWFGESRTWAVNFALRLELNQLSDTDEHCPIGGLLGLTLMPAPVRPGRRAAAGPGAAAAGPGARSGSGPGARSGPGSGSAAAGSRRDA